MNCLLTNYKEESDVLRYSSEANKRIFRVTTLISDNIIYYVQFFNINALCYNHFNIPQMNFVFRILKEKACENIVNYTKIN